MSASVVFSDDRVKWSMTRDNEGHRDYRITHKVETTSALDGPATVLLATGLPTIGSFWNYGNDLDQSATCKPDATVRPMIDRERNRLWEVEQLFSTRPSDRCQDDTIENPLDEPMKLSGSFLKYTKEAQRDRNGKLILSSSWERIVGLERDYGRPQVVIEQNVPTLGLETFSQMIDFVNDSPMWGLSARCVKLSDCQWQRKHYGTCFFFYTRRLVFDIRYDTFDISDAADRGFRVYKGSGGTDNPANFEHYKDGKGENVTTPVMLDGNGGINTDPANNPVFIPTVQLYDQTNLFSLGIPSSL